MVKQRLSFFLVVTMLFTLIGNPVKTVYAESDYTYNDIQGGVQITRYTGTSKDINIPRTIDGKTVKRIGREAFAHKQLKSVTIPDSVTSIGNSAFNDNQLTSITIPDNITSISDYAFNGNQLTSIIIPDSVINIGDSAFSNNQLESVTIPNGFVYIGKNVFSNNRLKSIILPDSVTSIDNGAFSNNQLESVMIPGVVVIGDIAFSNNKLESITIPDSVEFIGLYAFGKNQLTSITIPDSVTTIGIRAFFDNQLTSVTISDNVNVGSVAIGNGFKAFYDQEKKAGEYIFSENKWSLKVADNTAPTVSTYAPLDDAKDVAINANLVLTFSENVSAVSGKNIEIYDASDDSVVETIASDSGGVTVSNNKVTINPTNNLANSK